MQFASGTKVFIFGLYPERHSLKMNLIQLKREMIRRSCQFESWQQRTHTQLDIYISIHILFLFINISHFLVFDWTANIHSDMRECFNFFNVCFCSNTSVCVVENDIVFCAATAIVHMNKCMCSLLLVVFCFNVSHLKYRCILSVRRIAIIIIELNVIFFSTVSMFSTPCMYVFVLFALHRFLFLQLSFALPLLQFDFVSWIKYEAIADMRLQFFVLLNCMFNFCLSD